MSNRVQTDIIINLDDKSAVSRLAKIDSVLGDINKTLGGFGGQAVGLNQAMELFGKAADNVRKVFQAAQEGAANKDVFAGFDTQMRKLGTSAEQGLGQFRAAVSGTVDDITIMQTANKALISGLDPQLIATSMEYVTKYARQAGGDATQMLQTVITGLTRGSTEFLDDVGIIVSQTAVVNQKTKEWGRSLTDAEKKQVILAEALQQMNEKMSDFDGLADSQSEKIQRLTAGWTNWKNAMKGAVADMIVPETPKPYQSKYSEYKHLQGLLGGYEKGRIKFDAAEVERMRKRRNDLRRQLEWEKNEKIKAAFSGGNLVKQAQSFNADLKKNSALISEEELKAANAGLSQYQLELKRIQEIYDTMPKYTPELKKQADAYLKLAKKTAYVNLQKPADDKTAQSAKKAGLDRQRDQERIDRDIASAGERLTRDTENLKTEIKIAALSEGYRQMIALDDRYTDQVIRAQAQLQADLQKVGARPYPMSVTNKYFEEKAQADYEAQINALAKAEAADNIISKKESARIQADYNAGLLKARKELKEAEAEAEKLGNEKLKQLAQERFDYEVKLLETQKTSEIGLAVQRRDDRTGEIKKDLERDNARIAMRYAPDYLYQKQEIEWEYKDMLLDENTAKKTADLWHEQKLAALDYITVMDGVKEVFDTLESSVASFATTFAQTGKLDLSGLAGDLAQTLQVYAAEKVAHLTMEYAFNQLMALIHPENAKYAENAAFALQGIPVFAGFVAGSGLAAMAHDGIDYVPKTGTWLLEQGERVVDKRLNADLKDFIKNFSGASGGVVVNATFYNSDQESVTKALPDLQKTIINAVAQNISTGGVLKTTIQTYTR